MSPVGLKVKFMLFTQKYSDSFKSPDKEAHTDTLRNTPSQSLQQGAHPDNSRCAIHELYFWLRPCSRYVCMAVFKTTS